MQYVVSFRLMDIIINGNSVLDFLYIMYKREYNGVGKVFNSNRLCEVKFYGQFE